MKRKISKKISKKNTASYQKVLKDMEKKLSKAYKILSSSMLKNAPLKTLQKQAHELMLLLGETNYLAKECKKMDKNK